jgi:adenine-specific DNA methylase
MKDRRFIEETFPVKEVSEESVREKGIRRGHISALHVWWARRPLASSRATSFASLVEAPKNNDELQRLKRLIVELSTW